MTLGEGEGEDEGKGEGEDEGEDEGVDDESRSTLCYHPTGRI